MKEGNTNAITNNPTAMFTESKVKERAKKERAKKERSTFTSKGYDVVAKSIPCVCGGGGGRGDGRGDKDTTRGGGRGDKDTTRNKQVIEDFLPEKYSNPICHLTGHTHPFLT